MNVNKGGQNKLCISLFFCEEVADRRISSIRMCTNERDMGNVRYVRAKKDITSIKICRNEIYINNVAYVVMKKISRNIRVCGLGMKYSV